MSQVYYIQVEVSLQTAHSSCQNVAALKSPTTVILPAPRCWNDCSRCIGSVLAPRVEKSKRVVCPLELLVDRRPRLHSFQCYNDICSAEVEGYKIGHQISLLCRTVKKDRGVCWIETRPVGFQGAVPVWIWTLAIDLLMAHSSQAASFIQMEMAVGSSCWRDPVT